MVDNKKNLIIKKNTIFNKIINFFKNIFKIKEDNVEDKNNININNNFIGHEFKHDLDYQEEKKKVLDIYNKIKEGKINIEELDAITLIQVNQMAKAEINLKMNKYT